MCAQTSIALVDTHTLVRQAIRMFLDLEEDLLVVGEADTGELAIQLALDARPNVMLLDINILDRPVVSVLQEVKRVSIDTQIVLLGTRSEDQQILPALRAGALSYATIDINVAELVDVLRKASRKETVLMPQVATHLISKLQALGIENPAQLSEREREILLFIAQAYSNAEIAEKINISERTVKNHVSSLLSKLYMKDRTQLAVFTWKQGLISRHILDSLPMASRTQDIEPLRR